MEELQRAIELAFEETETPEDQLSDFEKYIYNEVRMRVLLMKRDQVLKEIAMLQKFRSQVKRLIESAE